MHISHFVVQIAVLIIFVISAYKAISSLSTKTLVECLYHASVAVVALAYLLLG